MMEFIKADLRRYFIIAGKSFNPPKVMKMKIILENFGFQAILVYRMGHWIATNKSLRANSISSTSVHSSSVPASKCLSMISLS